VALRFEVVLDHEVVEPALGLLAIPLQIEGRPLHRAAGPIGRGRPQILDRGLEAVGEDIQDHRPDLGRGVGIAVEIGQTGLLGGDRQGPRERAFYFLAVRRAGWPVRTLLPLAALSVSAATLLLPDQRETLKRLSEILITPAEIGLVGWIAVRTVRSVRSTAGPEALAL
jgi:hypothetical protein